MKSFDKLKPNFFDLIPAAAIVVLALLAVLCFRSGLQHSENITVAIMADGETVQKITLSQAEENETRTFSHNGITLTLCLNPNGETGVQVISSDCPTGDCIRTGTVTHSGESIVCLPARTVISLQGGDASGVDAVIG